MYGYRKSLENGLMTNLNSISSSLSSIDTIGRRGNTLGKSSVDNLIGQSRTQSIASTSALYRSFKDDRYPTMTRNGGPRYQTSDVYNDKRIAKMGTCCLNSETAFNFSLIPLLLLTILRQVFDFLGQIWLQILINFFTILIIIFALFGVRQNRLSYLLMFMLWAIFNTIWNLLVISIHSKLRDVNLTEDFLSLYTGATSWWQSNGPGCLPYTITAPIQHQSVSILKPNIITGCRIDYHFLESTQAALHASLSLISMMICCLMSLSVRRRSSSNIKGSSAKGKQTNGADRPYRLNDLTTGRSSAKINHDPYPSVVASTATSRFVSNGGTASLRRSTNKRAGSRSSQHSLVSARSERRRQRQASEAASSGVPPTPRGSTSSAQRSQKYVSLSSRRSRSGRRTGAAEVTSLTYASTSTGPRAGTSSAATSGQRNRLSSLSSADYLPSYQPPHSSSANLLSSYGEISSIDSYNNRASHNKGRHKAKERDGLVGAGGGNTNPTYTGSRSSVCSQNVGNMNNYDDISAIYGGGGTMNGSTYGVSAGSHERTRYSHGEDKRAQVRNRGHHVDGPRDIRAEIYNTNSPSFNPNGHLQQPSRTNGFVANGGTFQSFSASSQQNLTRLKSKESSEVNNNHLASNYMEATNNQTNGNHLANQGANNDWSRPTMASTSQPSYIG